MSEELKLGREDADEIVNDESANTAEPVEELEPEMISLEELDEISGGATVGPGNRTYRVKAAAAPVYNSYVTVGRRKILTLNAGSIVCYAKQYYVANTGVTWINFGGFRQKGGTTTSALNGWIEAVYCQQL